MGDWYIIYIFQKLVEIGHDRSDSEAKENLFKTPNENIHQKLCFILNTTKYFLVEVLFLSFLPLSTVPWVLCQFHSSLDSSLKGLQTADKPALLHWVLTLFDVSV